MEEINLSPPTKVESIVGHQSKQFAALGGQNNCDIK
jgi:hypothetical protein